MDAIVDMVNRLISLLKARDDRLDTVFEDIIEPMMDEMVLIHGDCACVFREIEARLRDSPSITDKNRFWFAQRQASMKPIRDKVQALATASLEFPAGLVNIRFFMFAVCDYLGTFTDNGERMNNGRRLKSKDCRRVALYELPSLYRALPYEEYRPSQRDGGVRPLTLWNALDESAGANGYSSENLHALVWSSREDLMRSWHVILEEYSVLRLECEMRKPGAS
jgi:hypothetical protein